MTTTVRAVFEGRVFRPEEPVQLEPNARYLLTVEHAGEPTGTRTPEAYPLTALATLAADMGVPDLATRHAWYARRRPAAGDGDEVGIAGDATER